MESLFLILAGLLIVICVWLSQTVNELWLFPVILIGGYLVISGFAGRCPLTKHLKKKLPDDQQSGSEN